MRANRSLRHFAQRESDRQKESSRSSRSYTQRESDRRRWINTLPCGPKSHMISVMEKRRFANSGPRTLGSVLPQATDPIVRRRGFQNGEILARWADIVGAEVAQKSVPEQLSYAHGSGIGATLRVRVESAWALEMQHLEPVIIERINTFFGHAAVSHLKLVQAPVPGEKAPQPVHKFEVTQAQYRALDQVVAGAEDDDLRAALRALGERVAERQK